VFSKPSRRAKNLPELGTQRSSVPFEVTIREDGTAPSTAISYVFRVAGRST